MDAPNFEVFCADPQLVGEPVSKAWATFFAAMEGLALDEEGIELFRAATGRDCYEPHVYTEATGIIGRRGEKTSTALKFLLWKILFAGWEKQLPRSWFARVARHTRLLRIPIIAQDMRVARDIQRTAESLVLNSPILAGEVADVFTTEIIFRHGISLLCLPASKASTRGFTCPAAFLDELAWVSIEGADDKELVRQVKPSMIQFGQSRRLIKMSTPWQKSGVIYDEFAHRAERPDLLVWQASTEVMTPRIAREDLARERAADETYFLREYEAQFTDDLESFLPASDIHAAIQSWRELAPEETNCYFAALDASGLSGGDSFVFGVAHGGPGGAAVDLVRGWRRAPVAQVLDEVAQLARVYRIEAIVADQFSFTFVAELLRERRVQLEQFVFTSTTKMEIYFSLKNMLAQNRLQLPDHPQLARELRMLESIRTSGGAYRISAPRGQHDDFCTVAALLAHLVKQPVLEDIEPMFEVISVPRFHPSEAPHSEGESEREANTHWHKL